MEIKDFPTTIEMPVQWGEMDALGHVNNVIYFRYFESVRMHYFNSVNFDLATGTVAPILAETTCRFWKPLFYPDVITVGARTVSMGNTSFVMEYAIFSPKIGLVATGKGIIVCYDYKNKQKMPVPDDIRERITVLDNLK